MVDVGDRVDLDPFTGTITLPEAFVTMLRESGVTSIEGGGGETILLVDPTDEEPFAFFEFGPSELPEQGALTSRSKAMPIVSGPGMRVCTASS